MNGKEPTYLDPDRVSAVKKTETPAYGLTRDGYTQLAGAPDGLMVRVEGGGPWRRLCAPISGNSGVNGVPDLSWWNRNRPTACSSLRQPVIR